MKDSKYMLVRHKGFNDAPFHLIEVESCNEKGVIYDHFWFYGNFTNQLKTYRYYNNGKKTELYWEDIIILYYFDDFELGIEKLTDIKNEVSRIGADKFLRKFKLNILCKR